MKNNKGFTFVEILAVLVLISLMMVIIVPNVQKVAYQSKVKLCKSKISLAEDALNLWSRDNNKCFTKEGGCNILSYCTSEGNVSTCRVKFEDLAKNNLVNYDKKVEDIDTLINPIDNSSLNNLEFNVTYNIQSKARNSTTTHTIDERCK